MDKGLLVREQTEGGQKLIDQLVRSGFPLRMAFWRKEDDDTRWHLYLITPLVEERGSFEAYRQVQAAVDSCSWPDPAEMIDTSMVMALEPTYPLAKLVGFYARGAAGRFNTWVRAEWVRDGAISGTYIYAIAPAPTPAAKN